MSRLITLGIVIGLAVYGYRQYREHSIGQSVESPAVASGFVAEPAKPAAAPAPAPASSFRCDGRTHCSQMTSCEEATYFLRNCPGVKMDGEGDGVPCEKQWCGDR